jgi:hypothetical protein
MSFVNGGTSEFSSTLELQPKRLKQQRDKNQANNNFFILSFING